MAIDPRHLRLLRAIVEQGAFSRAGETQGLSQPALSAAMAQLERKLGVRVLDRSRRGAAPNVFGEILFRYACALDQLLEQAEAEVLLKKSGREGPLILGGTPYALLSLVPAALGLLEREGINPPVRLVEAEDADLNAMLLTYRVELAIGTIGLEASAPDFHEEALATVPFDVVVRATNPLAGKAEFTLDELKDASWVIPSPGGSFRRQIEALFLTCGTPLPADMIVCPTIGVIKAMVGQTDRVALLPRNSVEQECSAGTLRRIRLAHRSALRSIGVRWLSKRRLSPIAERFRLTLRSVGEGFASELGSSID